ncbi:ATP-binding protein [Mangrovibacterium sp.]|uniref:ATP-binding protein n=1 Tax=Mangrovibacterium sp. TaxID=1961364 RepID=UPI00356559E9
MKHTSCILFCRCGANLISDKRADDLANSLKELDADVIELHDLCAFSVHAPQKLVEMVAGYRQKTIVACYPRAIKYLLQQGGAELGDYRVLNFRELNDESIITQLHTTHSIARGEANYRLERTDLTVPAWYPVIDVSRCTVCGQCARFCLFGVYRFKRKSLEVVNPLSCKNNCPACGRTCPAQAIIFPRLVENSVLSGALPTAISAKNEGQQSSLLAQLNQRNQARQSIFRPDVLKLAEDERQQALEEIKKMNRLND